MAKANPHLKSPRKSARKKTHPIELSKVVLGINQVRFASGGNLIEVSSSGFKITLNRNELSIQKYRNQLNLDDLVGEEIWIHLNDLDLVIDGTVTRTRFLGKGLFEVGIDYSYTAPDYWRDSLVDLLPNPHEFDSLD